MLVRENATAHTAVSSFDYSDLNAYLVVVVGLVRPDGDQVELYNSIMAKAQQGSQISLREIQPICRQERLVSVASTGNLSQAIEILGSGIQSFDGQRALGRCSRSPEPIAHGRLLLE